MVTSITIEQLARLQDAITYLDTQANDFHDLEWAIGSVEKVVNELMSNLDTSEAELLKSRLTDWAS